MKRHYHEDDFVDERAKKSEDGRSPQEKARAGERDRDGKPVKR